MLAFFSSWKCLAFIESILCGYWYVWAYVFHLLFALTAFCSTFLSSCPLLNQFIDDFMGPLFLIDTIFKDHRKLSKKWRGSVTLATPNTQSYLQCPTSSPRIEYLSQPESPCWDSNLPLSPPFAQELTASVVCSTPLSKCRASQQNSLVAPKPLGPLPVHFSFLLSGFTHSSMSYSLSEWFISYSDI